MAAVHEQHLICDQPKPGIFVIRFTHPDLRDQLDGVPRTECALFNELERAVLARIRPGEVLILNFGIVEWFPTAFYSVLLECRKRLQEKNARLILCTLKGQFVREGLDLMGSKGFEVEASEESALRAASGKR